MSASHVTSLMLTLLAAGFLELFISSHLQFIHNFSHVFLLSLSRLCYHPEQFYFKNQQLGLLTGLTLLGGSFSFFCWTSSLNSLDHPHSFSLLSSLASLSYLYTMFCYFEHSLVNFLSSLALLFFWHNLLVLSQWIQLLTKFAEHHCRKSSKAEWYHYVFMVRILNRA